MIISPKEGEAGDARDAAEAGNVPGADVGSFVEEVVVGVI